MVEILDNPRTPSVFLHGMAGSKLSSRGSSPIKSDPMTATMPIATAHGEGRASFDAPYDAAAAEQLLADQQVSIRYVDNYLKPTEQYPANPNGSPLGIAGVRSPDGRVLALMPHCERTILSGVGSWVPDREHEEWGQTGPWIRVFQSARRWVG
jgi:phosphoribosylformylglycinamidine synthase